MDLALRADGGRVWIPVRAQPRGGRSEVCGVVPETGALKVRLAAPPVDGAANEELLRFLGREVLRVAPSTLRLARGATGRDKLVEVSGLSLEEVRSRLLGA
jgi:hypothetical protein